MVRDILLWPAPGLSRKAAPVDAVDAGVRALVQDLFDTMYAAPGVGLAAPQVGVLRAVIVLDTRPRQPESRPMAMVNPRIVERTGTTTYREGCLSIPGEAEEVERAERVVVEYLDEHGEPQRLACEGLLSIAVQHETDHLLGIVYPDHLSPLTRSLMRRRMRRRKRERVRAAAVQPGDAL
ncbi:MAG TPA: peptide deformylase [Myxococcaceae bacterium]|jgi:peptide deformylase|nr:peptide deformylase [Myxococcaceae bacterium]